MLYCLGMNVGRNFACITCVIKFYRVDGITNDTIAVLVPNSVLIRRCDTMETQAVDIDLFLYLNSFEHQPIL